MAQLQVLQTAALSEAQERTRRTRLESKSKLELAATVAKSKLENAQVAIQRTASVREETIDEEIQGELAAAAAAAERTMAEVALREEQGKKAKRELIANEEEAKTMKRQIAVLEDRIKQQRKTLAQVSQKVLLKEKEVAAFEHRIRALTGIKKLASPKFAEEEKRKQLARSMSFQASIAANTAASVDAMKSVQMLSSVDKEDRAATKLPAI